MSKNLKFQSAKNSVKGNFKGNRISIRNKRVSILANNSAKSNSKNIEKKENDSNEPQLPENFLHSDLKNVLDHRLIVSTSPLDTEKTNHVSRKNEKLSERHEESFDNIAVNEISRHLQSTMIQEDINYATNSKNQSRAIDYLSNVISLCSIQSIIDFDKFLKNKL
ncbi:MAG: hypothetical protein MHMPM18_004008 [Marteilia pararefringens]